MEQYGGLILMVLVIGVMYFMLIRPENKRKKQAEEMRNNLKKGDKITTIGGIIGKIISVSDESIVIETSEDRVRMELTKWSISTNNSQHPAEKKGKAAKDAAEEEEKPAEIEETSGEKAE